jgi:prephenate dehydratase
LIKIESRPLRERPWEYYFFLDLKGHRREARVARALEAVRRRALRLKVLGSYPAAPDPEP